MSVCFLMPVHPPHFGFANGFIKSFETFGYQGKADVCLVFTNEQERDQFVQEAGAPVKTLVLPQDLRNFENRGIINIKKIWALSQLADSPYKYIIIIDAETELVRAVDVEALCDSYFANKVLLGNLVPAAGRKRTEAIKYACKRFFFEHPKRALLDTDLYLWFNQPCIYKTDTLHDFMAYFLLPDRAIKNLTWYDFDYYIYMYYLLLEQDFTLVDLGICSNYGVCEVETLFIQFANENYKDQRIMMCSRNVLKQFDNDNLFLMVHLDRDEAWVINNMQNRIFDLEERLEHLNMQNRIFELEERLEHLIRPPEVKNEYRKQVRRFLAPFKYTAKWLCAPFRIAFLVCKSLWVSGKKDASLHEVSHD